MPPPLDDALQLNREGDSYGCAALDSMLAEGAVDPLHDTYPESSDRLGPRYLLEQLGGDPTRSGILNLHTPDGFGVGLIRKNAPGTAKLILPSLLDEIGERLRHNRICFQHYKE